MSPHADVAISAPPDFPNQWEHNKNTKFGFRLNTKENNDKLTPRVEIIVLDCKNMPLKFIDKSSRNFNKLYEPKMDHLQIIHPMNYVLIILTIIPNY